MKIWIILLFVVLSFGREDPFTPLINPRDSLGHQSDTDKTNFTDILFQLPSTARIIKEATITYQNIDGSISTQNIKIDKSLDWHYPITISQSAALSEEYPKEQNFTLGKFNIITKGEDVYINTDLLLLRDFVLPEPFRINVDLEDTSPNPTQEVVDSMLKGVESNSKYVKKIHIEKHNNLYRIVFSLDGRYAYKVRKSKEGYLLSLE